MSTTQQQQQVTAIPAGVWQSDTVHSTFDFSVKHMVVATFRGSLPDFAATLAVDDDGAATLEAVGQLTSVVTQDENLTGHLQSPDFFETERLPEVRYRSTEIVRDGEDLVVRGELTLKGVTRPVELTGTIAGPVGDLIAVDLQTSIDRTDYGLSWNAPLPGGGFAVGDTVRLNAHLEMNRS